MIIRTFTVVLCNILLPNELNADDAISAARASYYDLDIAGYFV